MGNKKSRSSATELTENEIRLLENNTNLSRQEIYAWHQKFVSEYPDGTIDQKEFAQIFKSLHPNGNAEKYAKIAFKAFDEDNTGKISFEEFLLATSFVTAGGRDRDKALDFAFDIYDKDNNGKITKSELTQVVSAIYEMEGLGANAGKQRVADIFQRFDTDGNKALDKYEFVNFISTDPVCSKLFN